GGRRPSEAGYTRAAQRTRVHEALHVFRESYRRPASRFTPVGREAPEAATGAITAFEDVYQRTSRVMCGCSDRTTAAGRNRTLARNSGITSFASPRPSAGTRRVRWGRTS